jgi:threonylcarbamoyladenosine tRNA methylthiotransferase MtaB
MRFSVLSFGCRANQAESCQIERDLRAGGGVPAASDSADVVVVNTCSVTAAADAASRRAIRSVARANPRAQIVATGCYATRKPDDVARLPGVVRLVRNAGKPQIAELITPGVVFEPAGGNNHSGRDYRGGWRPEITPGVTSLGLRPGDRGRTAYPLNVQTGCDERCAYCIVPSTRGPGQSRSVAQVVEEVRRIAEAGFREVWLTGVHLGSYGRDLAPPSRLIDLLRALDQEAAALDVTFRLSSLEPMDCSDEIIDLVAASPRFAPHLHLPLQHASDRMLAAMRRAYTASRFRATTERARARMPDAAIGTDVIAGFPGETERDVSELESFLREISPAYLHVFPYSDRPGTAAFAMPAKVPAPVVRRRAERLRVVARELSARFADGQVGRERAALTLDDGAMALTDNYLKLRIARGRARNERVRVRIIPGRPLRGEVVA